MIIGLAGYARSGKDTVATALVESLSFRRLAFADALKDVLEDVNPFIGTTRLSNRLSWHGWEAAKADPEVRSLLQKLGVACRVHIHPDVWVNAVMSRIDNALECRWVISDVRFPNELLAIRKAGGEIWRIDRPGCRPVNSHQSETALDGAGFDFVLANNGTLDDLHSKAVMFAGDRLART